MKFILKIKKLKNIFLLYINKFLISRFSSVPLLEKPYIEVIKIKNDTNTSPNLLYLNLIKFLFISTVRKANNGIKVVRLKNINKPNKNKYFDSKFLFFIVLLRMIKI